MCVVLVLTDCLFAFLSGPSGCLLFCCFCMYRAAVCCFCLDRCVVRRYFLNRVVCVGMSCMNYYGADTNVIYSFGQ